MCYYKVNLKYRYTDKNILRCLSKLSEIFFLKENTNFHFISTEFKLNALDNTQSMFEYFYFKYKEKTKKSKPKIQIQW